MEDYFQASSYRSIPSLNVRFLLGSKCRTDCTILGITSFQYHNALGPLEEKLRKLVFIGNGSDKYVALHANP
jgi:hypothetical protein